MKKGEKSDGSDAEKAELEDQQERARDFRSMFRERPRYMSSGPLVGLMLILFFKPVLALRSTGSSSFWNKDPPLRSARSSKARAAREKKNPRPVLLCRRILERATLDV